MEMTSLSFYLESKSLINEMSQNVMKDQIDPTLFKKKKNVVSNKTVLLQGCPEVEISGKRQKAGDKGVH